MLGIAVVFRKVNRSLPRLPRSKKRHFRTSWSHLQGHTPSCSSVTTNFHNPPMPLDARVRAQFPALAGDITFMDNAGGSQVLKSVADAIGDYLLKTNVQLGASYTTSQISSQRVRAGVEAAATFVNAASADEVVIGASTTQLLQNLAHAMGPRLTPVSEIIVTDADHEANIGPFVRMAEKYNVTLKRWRVNEKTWRLEPSDLEPLLTENTRLVAMTHCSNILGTINDVAAVAKRVHKISGAEIVVDGVAFAPHRAVDVQALDVDFYAFSFYKVYGPHVSLLYGKHKSLALLSSINHHFLTGPTAYLIQPGNCNFELTYSLTQVLRYIEDLGLGDAVAADTSSRARIQSGFNLIAEHEESLSKLVIEFLLSVKEKYGVRIIGTESWARADRVPTIAFVVPGRSSMQIVTAIDSKQIGIRYGHFYAYSLIVDRLHLGNDGVVRISLVHYNTAEEALRLIDALTEVFSTLS